MIYFKVLEDSIRHFAEMMSAELAERRIYDPKEFEVFIKTRLYAALHELVKIETSDLEKRRNGLVDAYTSNIPAFQKEQLKGFIKEKFGAEELDNFFQNHLKKESQGVQFMKHPSKN